MYKLYGRAREIKELGDQLGGIQDQEFSVVRIERKNSSNPGSHCHS